MYLVRESFLQRNSSSFSSFALPYLNFPCRHQPYHHRSTHLSSALKYLIMCKENRLMHGKKISLILFQIIMCILISAPMQRILFCNFRTSGSSFVICHYASDVINSVSMQISFFAVRSTSAVLAD